MNRFLLVILFATISISSFSQTQRGLVKTNGKPNHAGVPLSGVVVKANGCSASLSDDEGKFKIAMPGKKEGEAFVLTRVSRNGYEMIDRNAVGRKYSFSSSVDVVLTMVSHAELEADKNRIRKNALDAAQREYEAQIGKLEADLENEKITTEAYAQSIQSLQSKMDKYRELVENLADKYARTDYDFIEGIDRDINLAIEAGQMERADSLIQCKGDLSERHQRAIEWRNASQSQRAAIEERLKEWNKSEQEREKELENLAEDYYNKFTIDFSRMQPREAYKWLKMRAELDPDRYEWVMEAGRYAKSFLADYTQSKSLLNQALAIAERNNQDDQIMIALNQIGGLHTQMNEYEEAQQCYQKVLEVVQKGDSIKADALATSYNNLGFVEFKLNNNAEALRYFNQALEICADTVNRVSIECYNNIAAVYKNMGDYRKALEYVERAIQLAGEESSHIMMGTLCSNKASFLVDFGRTKEAIGEFEKALEHQKKVLDENHPSIANTLQNLATAYVSLSQYSKAYDYTRDALKIMYHVYGEDHPKVAESYLVVAKVMHHIGKLKQAKECLSKSERIYSLFYKENSPVFIEIYNLYGLISSDSNDRSKSMEYYKKAEAIILANNLTNTQQYATICSNMGADYLGNGDYTNALLYNNKSLLITEQLVGKKNISYIHHLYLCASIYDQMESYDKSISINQEAEELMLANYGKYHEMLMIIYNNIGNSYIHKKDYGKAREYLFKSLEIVDSLYSGVHSYRMSVLGNIGMTYYNEHQYKEVIPWIAKASDIRVQLISGPPKRKYSYIDILNRCYWYAAKEGTLEDSLNLKAFVDSTICKVRVNDGENTARSMGLDGEYCLLRFAGWDLNSTHYLGDYFTSMEDAQPVQWVLLKDNKIEAYTFNTQKNGLSICIEPIDRKEKERISEAYKKWKEANSQNE